jgi:hypothetical protein
VARDQQTEFRFTTPRPRRKGDLPKVARRLSPLDDEEARLRLERRLSAHLITGRIALAVTDNRYTMISVKREKGLLYRIRLHHMFLGADSGTVRTLARYIAHNDGAASDSLSQFIESNQTKIRRARRRPPVAVTLETRGEIYDLQEIFDDLNRSYFRGVIDARITWGQRLGKRRRRNSIKMGSYSVEDRLIRIHPSLDRKFVPRFFVEWIVYHEMLHQVHDIPLIGGRRIFHTEAFLAQEAEFAHYARARRWEQDYLNRILNY